MIVCYDNKSGQIYGMVDGRVHDQDQIDRTMIRPTTVPVEQVSKYVVSFKKLTRVEKQDILEDQVDRATFKVIRDVKVGEREVVVPAGMEMDDEFKDFFTGVENGTIKLYDHEFKLDTNGKITDIVNKKV